MLGICKSLRQVNTKRTMCATFSKIETSHLSAFRDDLGSDRCQEEPLMRSFSIRSGFLLNTKIYYPLEEDMAAFPDICITQ